MPGQIRDCVDVDDMMHRRVCVARRLNRRGVADTGNFQR